MDCQNPDCDAEKPLVLLGKFQRHQLTEQTVEYFCENCRKIYAFVVDNKDVHTVRE
jgi:hypothetical protein